MLETRQIRDLLLSALGTPTVPREATRILGEIPTDRCLRAATRMLRLAHLRNPRLNFRENSADSNRLTVIITHPYEVPVTFCVVRDDEVRAESIPTDAQVLLLAVDVSEEATGEMISTYVDKAISADRSRVVVDPEWLAGWLDENACQIALPQEQYARYPQEIALSDERADQHRAEVSIRRARTRLFGIEGAVLPDTGNSAERVRQLEADSPYEGPIYLCSTFLPPVSFSSSAVERFYRDVRHAGKPFLDFVRDKIRLEREVWGQHVGHYQRIDIIDRPVLEEYLKAPEYYQMSLTPSELAEQIANVCGLLENPNYALCLTNEAIDLAFEIRGNAVTIRTDRRNKGQPREGRVSGVILRGSAISADFQREFWGVYNRIDKTYRSRESVKEWLLERVSV